MIDRPIFDRINALAAEEEMLWERAGDGDGLDSPQRERLHSIRDELDECYFVLRERQARRSAGLDQQNSPSLADIADRPQP